MAEEEKRGKKSHSNPKKRINNERISIFILIVFSILIVAAAEMTNWFFSQQSVQDKLLEFWNALSLTTLHRKIIFSVQSVLPAGHDFSWLANGISSIYVELGKVIELVAPWSWIIPYAITAGVIGLLITKISEARVEVRELFTVSTFVFALNLFSYANQNVNFLDWISVIAFVLSNYFNPLILFFVCYASIFVGSEIMVFIFKNMRTEYRIYE